MRIHLRLHLGIVRTHSIFLLYVVTSGSSGIVRPHVLNHRIFFFFLFFFFFLLSFFFVFSIFSYFFSSTFRSSFYFSLHISVLGSSEGRAFLSFSLFYSRSVFEGLDNP